MNLSESQIRAALLFVDRTNEKEERMYAPSMVVNVQDGETVWSPDGPIAGPIRLTYRLMRDGFISVTPDPTGASVSDIAMMFPETEW